MTIAVDALVVLLVILTVAVRLGPAGWLAGTAFAVVGWAVLTEGLRRFDVSRFETVGRVVLARAVAVGGVAALVVETTDPRPDPDAAIIALAGVTLALTALGLRIATEASEFEARFAVEVDAFFVLALSALVAHDFGPWVLVIGALHYAFTLAGRVWPWLRAPLPTRTSRAAIAVAQGVVLTAAAVVQHPVTVVLTGLALLALLGSFAEDVRLLHRDRATAPAPETAVDSAVDSVPEPEETTEQPARNRSARWWIITALAGLFVLVGFVGPNRLGDLTIGTFTRIPIEGLMAAGLVLVLPAKPRRIAVIVIGAGLGLLTIVKMIDMGFYEVFDRPFHPIFDWSFFGPALDFVVTSAGQLGGVLAVIGVVLLVIGLLTVMVLAVRRLSSLAVANRTGATRALAALAMIWLVCALAGLQLTPREPVASRSAADHVYDDVRQIRSGLLDGRTFAAEAADDAYRYAKGDELLTALRGKDVLFVFVESYGRVAIENSDSAPTIDPILDEYTTTLAADGFDSRSAFLTSPTYGGGSWLAHATLQTGLWVDNPQRRTTLNSLDRTTLSIAFNRAGWRTIGIVPANTEDWPDGDMYHFDKVYDSRNVGYKGPAFSYATVPDQYTLQQFEHTERRRNGPVMAEIDLVSSHTPFTPVPSMVDWDDVGDGSIYNPMPAKGPQPGEVWPDPTKVRAAYTASIAYALKSLFSYIQTYGDDNLVTVFLGDHQPQPIVAAQEGSRDVPISIVAKDQKVIDAISGWDWEKGLNPDPKAPRWKMDAFRDKFLSAYGPAVGSASHKNAAPQPR